MNRQIILAERPRYLMPTHNCFELRQAPVPAPSDGEVLIRTLWLALDPYLHGRMKRINSQAQPVAIGDVMVGATVGRVQTSNHPDFSENDLVVGFWGWQDYCVSNGSRIMKLQTELERSHPSYALGAMSRVSGLGAYISMLHVAKPKPGETVVIGAATGGVGQIAGQLAKMEGARVVGYAGSPEKCDFAVKELGFDACVCHRDPDFGEALRDACAEGVHVYLESVGGEPMDHVLPLLNHYARVPVMGLIAQWSTGGTNANDTRMAFLTQVMAKRLRVEGVISNDFFQSHFRDFQTEMANWITTKQIKIVEHVVDGLEHAPRALQGMFQTGQHMGKLVVKVSE
ncbi:MAG: NADP-dependent oxidoreductase [Salinisphaeraceae bacterium]|nr:NADP-dependent oxidoreductase [Salinisphaeraceae bacterium]